MIVTAEDAEAHYRAASALREQGRLAEALAAFDNAVALKPDHAEAHNGRAIVLAMLRRFDEAVAGFDRAIALKPSYAEAYNNRAIVLQDLGRPAEALASFDRALALQPDNARGYNNRGDALRELGRLDDALASCDKAIALKPDYAQAHYNRGIILQDLRRLDDALASFDVALALKPDYAEAYNNRGVVRQDLKRLDEALADFRRAVALAPDYAEFNSNLAYCLLQMGQFEEGWRQHEWRKRTERPAGHRALPRPLWLGQEDISGKTVFVHWEQGLGDTIQFCRYGKLLQARGAKVVMAVQAPLHRVLQHLSPGIDIIKDDAMPPAFDYHCPLMSLPLAFATTLQTIPSDCPYIRSDEMVRRRWHERLLPTTKRRVGLVWAGNAKHRNEHNRSVALSALMPLFAVDAQWVALQKDLRPGDADMLRNFPQIESYGEQLGDFADTAALIDQLDLVIAVDTSVAHLAGAMGKPVWILLPANSDWRWLAGRDDSPWYPSARLFRQSRLGSWPDVVVRVAAALRDFLARGVPARGERRH